MIHRTGAAPLQPPAGGSAAPRGLLLAIGVLTAILIWSYLPVLGELVRDWKSDEDYSAGFFVPPVALYLIWERRNRILSERLKAFLPALLLILIGEIIRYVAMKELRQSVERYAFLIELSGIIALVVGPRAFRHLFWIMAFLFLMIPLPNSLNERIMPTLQQWATSGAYFLLELSNIVVAREGNILTLNHRVQVGVVEACSGLRMLTTFIMVAGFLALSVRRPAWQKVSLVVASLPIALASNIVRIYATAVALLYTDGNRRVEQFFHDFAGLAMMPVAVVFLGILLFVMSRLVIDDEPPGKDPTSPSRGSAVA